MEKDASYAKQRIFILVLALFDERIKKAVSELLDGASLKQK